ncbi:hypothetical protein BU17DRAFT_65000 [Hysterangium stoloniferum]|nr:hypothetical protein BU17DRAFT_65000 [Hysterangium stoloniferum]
MAIRHHSGKSIWNPLVHLRATTNDTIGSETITHVETTSRPGGSQNQRRASRTNLIINHQQHLLKAHQDCITALACIDSPFCGGIVSGDRDILCGETGRNAFATLLKDMHMDFKEEGTVWSVNYFTGGFYYLQSLYPPLNVIKRYIKSLNIIKYYIKPIKVVKCYIKVNQFKPNSVTSLAFSWLGCFRGRCLGGRGSGIPLMRAFVGFKRPRKQLSQEKASERLKVVLRENETMRQQRNRTKALFDLIALGVNVVGGTE